MHEHLIGNNKAPLKKIEEKMHIMVLFGSFCKLWQILKTNSIWRKGMCICDQKFISLSTKMFLVSVLAFQWSFLENQQGEM